jgi:uncharacterized protein YjaG (DUF416 family)
MAALTCEKTQPLYADFCEAEEWGDPTLYTRGIAALYSFSSTGSTAAATQVLAETQFLFPDLDDFDSYLVSYAFDAGTVLEEALLFVAKQEETHFRNHLSAVTDCIDTFVQMYLELDPNQEDLNEVIQADSYMCQEHERRARLFAALSTIPDITPSSITSLKSLNGTYPLVALERLAGL